MAAESSPVEAAGLCPAVCIVLDPGPSDWGEDSQATVRSEVRVPP